MGLKDIVKVANYYDVKYGFNKEAQNWEDLADNKAFKPNLNQELWSEEYKTYMKWDGSRWVPQERYDIGSKDFIATDPYQSVNHRGTHYRDDRTGLEYTIEPGTERRIPIEAKKFLNDVAKKPEQEPTLEESLSGIGSAGALEKIKLEPLPFRPYKEPKTDTKVDKPASKPASKPAAGGKMPTLGDKDSLYMQAVLMRDSFKKNPQLKQYEQEARSLANSWGTMPKDQFKQRLFDLQFRALKAANPEALPGLKPGKLEKII